VAAVACLRVATPSDRLSNRDLGPLISKFTTAFLEVRWRLPRQYAPLSNCSFLLTDPAAHVLDAQELGYLSHELQTRLFGTSATPQSVMLLLFEGGTRAIGEFAGLSNDDLRRAIDDPSLLPEGGRLSVISASGQRVQLTTPADSGASEIREAPTPQRARLTEAYQGIYFATRELFIGDLMTCTPANAGTYYSLTDGGDHLPHDQIAFDGDCATAAAKFLRENAQSGLVYVPVSFSSLMRASERSALVERLSQLPPEGRDRLSAVVYEAPREPSYQAIAKIHETLDPYFHGIDLLVDDPNFAIEQCARRAVTSVTFTLPAGDQQVRLAALKRFASKFDHYKRRLIWPAMTNVRTRTEVELATQLRVPFISGPAVCGRQLRHIGGRPWTRAQLPVSAPPEGLPATPGALSYGL
jgi:hypothetical protein